MITKENIKEILQDLSKEYIENAVNKNHDYIGLWVHTANAGFHATLVSYDYDKAIEKEFEDNGMMFIDKDTFMIVLEQNNIEL